jgi:exportin-5
MLRVLKNIVPEFAASEPISPQSTGANMNTETKRHGNPWVSPNTASAIREYISADILKACVTSLHEPYFVDQQKELASLIATVVVNYHRLTTTARDILVSLPNMKAEEVDKGIEFMARNNTSSRGQRSVILELLRDLKGVSISEMGKLSKSIGLPPSQHTSRKSTRSRMAQKFMMASEPTDRGTTGASTEGMGNGSTEGTNGLDGLAGLFEI